MTYVKTDIFVNLSSAKKALNFTIGETNYTMALSLVEKLIAGEIKTFTLSKYELEKIKE